MPVTPSQEWGNRKLQPPQELGKEGCIFQPTEMVLAWASIKAPRWAKWPCLLLDPPCYLWGDIWPWGHTGGAKYATA